MELKISKGRARGVVQAPPSKSMAHRMLLCAGLAEGESVVHNVAFSEDILATIDVLRAIGATCRIDGDTVTATAHILHKGKTLHQWHVDIRNGAGDLISSVEVTNFVMNKPK